MDKYIIYKRKKSCSCKSLFWSQPSWDKPNDFDYIVGYFYGRFNGVEAKNKLNQLNG